MQYLRSGTDLTARVSARERADGTLNMTGQEETKKKKKLSIFAFLSHPEHHPKTENES